MNIEDDTGLPSTTTDASTGSMFADGKDATHRYGVLYQGAWETMADGTCRAVRRHARALRDHGKLNVLLKSFSHTRRVDGRAMPIQAVDHDKDVLDEVDGLHISDIGTMALSIKHMVAMTPDQVRAAIFPRGVVGKDAHDTKRLQQYIAGTTVLYTVWERDRIPEEMASIMSRAGQCWVPCRQNAEMLIKSGVPSDLVRIVPHPFLSSELDASSDRTFSPDHPAFYSIGAWQPRKGFHELIGAYLIGFESRTNATLTLRTDDANWPGYPSVRESLMYWLSDARVKANGWTAENMTGKLVIHLKKMTPDQLHELHRSNNIYVSASHGEAWNLPAFDAKLHGNIMVYVPWGGTTDFASAFDVEVQFAMEKSPPIYNWESQWAGYEISDLASAMVRSVNRLSYTTPEQIWSLDFRFGEKFVGGLMRENLYELSKSIHRGDVTAALFGCDKEV